MHTEVGGESTFKAVVEAVGAKQNRTQGAATGPGLGHRLSDNACMSDRTFRFGMIATPQSGRDAWVQLAHHVEEMGYSTLLMPDGLQLLSPFVSLSVAAAATTSLRVGTFVVASPLRAPRLTAWDAHSTSVITDGRFEFGIGTGRPEVAQQAVDLLGMAQASPAQRLTQIEQTIDALRELDGDQHTPVMIAAGGPKARAVAAAKADIVALAAPPRRSSCQ
jgi:alkanesulfonate monooxygenase SsuD/methylene tetrahydromethanopterin reductase-like flavin-dependent oxidoreductase (luciferase family)